MTIILDAIFEMLFQHFAPVKTLEETYMLRKSLSKLFPRKGAFKWVVQKVKRTFCLHTKPDEKLDLDPEFNSTQLPFNCNNYSSANLKYQKPLPSIISVENLITFLS